MEKTLNYEVIQNQHTNLLVKENIIELTHCVQNGLEMLKNSKKSCKKTHLRLNLFLLKCFSITHIFLDWYEILATQTRLICATFSIFSIGNKYCMKKKQAVEIHCNPKMSGFWTLNCFQTLKKTWIYMRKLPQ